MELTAKTLRKFFLDAFEQTVIPRLDSIDSELIEIRKEMKEFDRRLLDLEEKIIPELRSIQEQFGIVVRELEFIKKSGGNKIVLKKVDALEKLIAKKSREIIQLGTKIKKFEMELKQLKNCQKRKTAK